MKVSPRKSLGLGICCVLALAASALAQDDATQDDVARRTERALFKMSQVDTGAKKVRVVTPTTPATATAPLVGPPVEMTENEQAAPMPQAASNAPQAAAPSHEPTLFEDSSCNPCDNDCCCDPCCCCLCGPPGNCWVR